MADGLLTSGLNWIDQQKQALKARFGLLADNPEEFARQLAAEQRQRAGVGLLGEPKTAQEMASGAWINSPYGRQAMEAGSGFVGSISPLVREGNPIQSAVVLIGDKIFTGRTHTDALQRALYEGAVRKEAGKLVFPKDVEINSDLFMTKDGRIIDRLQAYKMFDIGGAEQAIESGIMQNKPSGSMSVNKYMEEAKKLKSKIAPQQAALDIASQNAEKMLGLPKGNTPMDRAKAMGFSESGYTGTNRDITAFDPSKAGASGSGSREGALGTWLTNDPRVASGFADWSARGQGGNVVYPLMIRGKNPKEFGSYAEIKDLIDANTQFVRPPYRMMQDTINYENAKKALGDYGVLRNTMTDAIDVPITQYVVPDPSRLRSRFAAFDPARINEPDILAAGVPLGLLAGTNVEMPKKEKRK